MVAKLNIVIFQDPLLVGFYTCIMHTRKNSNFDAKESSVANKRIKNQSKIRTKTIV